MTEAAPFWQTTPLAEMSEAEWESLCDGCGKCCTFTLENEDTGELFNTRVACRLFDSTACGCSDYSQRFVSVPTCIKITPEIAGDLHFLPDTCAYRLVAAGHRLPDWHHLVCGDREAVHRLGWSVRGQTISETVVEASGATLEDHIVVWRRRPRRRKPQ
jgi:uncharacterized cysteine cluster protein YcgN (CxxCxxCC family)